MKQLTISILESALSDSARFKEIIKNTSDLLYVVKKYPSYTNKLMTCVFRPDEFYRIFTDYDDIRRVAQAVTAASESLYSRAYINFSRYIKNARDMSHLAEKYPQGVKYFAEMMSGTDLIRQLLENPDSFPTIVKDLGQVKFLASKYPKVQLFKNLVSKLWFKEHGFLNIVILLVQAKLPIYVIFDYVLPELMNVNKITSLQRVTTDKINTSINKVYAQRAKNIGVFENSTSSCSTLTDETVQASVSDQKQQIRKG